MPAVRPDPSSGKRTAQFMVVTGLSGAGKSAAIHALEDLGYLCVDNLPTVLIPTLADLTLGEGAIYNTVAVVVDARDRSFLDRFAGVFKSLRARRDLATWLIFLEASDAAPSGHPPDLPGGVGCGITATLQRDAPAPSAGANRVGHRRNPGRTGATPPHQENGGQSARYVGSHGARAASRLPRALAR